MKQLLTIAGVVFALLAIGCSYDDSSIIDRLEQLENNSKIASLQQQIDAINTTLPELKQADAELKEYIATLQSTAANLEQKIEETNSDIAELETALDKAIKDAEASNNTLKEELLSELNTAKTDILAQLQSTKTALEAELNQINSTITTLQTKDTELEGKIATLEEYVNTELQNTENWATATFATLEQYNTIVEDVATIKVQIEALNTSLNNLEERINAKIATDIATVVNGLEAELATKVTEITTAYTTAISTAKAEITAAYTEAIATAIANIESSMKQWINEQLAGYYTIAEVDAALKTLEESITDGDAAISEEINNLSERINSMKTDITMAYQSAIAAAIAENNGVFNTKMANEIAAVNSRIDTEVAAINSRIETLEGRIEALEDIINKIQALDIIFDIESGVACMAGASIEFGYIIVGGDNDTVVECFGDGGWSAYVVSSTLSGGRIRVTAPNFGGNGKVVVLATSGAGGACMKSIRFDKGILTDILDTYEVDWEACTLNVTLRTNLDYTVNIPVDWITVADTRAALREETLAFSIAENPDVTPRSAVINLTGECGDVLQSFEITQKLQPSDAPIEFADKYAKLVCVEKFDTNGDGELSYKEASRVTYIEENFLGMHASAVKSFDEFQYFVNVKTLDSTFRECRSLKSIIIPEGVTEIGGYAFYNCNNLTNVTIPDSVNTIGFGAFNGCSSLTKVTIPECVTTIGSYAFSSCNNLTSITIPDSVTTIGYGAFYNCGNLAEIKGKFASDDGRCLIIDGLLKSFAPNGITSYTIPDCVTTIDNYTFNDCDNLTSITIPDSVTTIGDLAFYGCRSLTSVTIPDSVTSIGNMAFQDCTSLTSVVIGDSVTTIKHSTFSCCYSLSSVTIGDSVTEIGNYAFLSCSSLSNVTIPNSVIAIGYEAFAACRSLTNVTIPNSVIAIGYEAFEGCNSLTNVTIGDSVTSIGYKAFYDCESLTSVYCKAITPPSIEDGVFDNNGDGRKIYVPAESVEAYKAAEGWSDYADAIIGYDFENGEIVEVQPNNEIWYTSSDGDVVTPYYTNVFGANITSNTYTDGKGVITFDGNVTTIGEDAFYDCTRLTSVTIPDSVTTIGEYAFYSCDSLTSVTIPDSVTTIGKRAFYNCESLINIAIPNSVVTIGAGAFNECRSLTDITIGDNVAEIGDGAFGICESLTSVTIPNSVTTIGDGPFYQCLSLKSFKGKYAEDNGRVLIKDNKLIAYANASGATYSVPDDVVSIGNDAFFCCINLSSVTLPDNLVTIEEGAFYECINLTSINIPNNVTTIGDSVFCYCDKLKEITIPENVKEIGDYAFHGCSSLISVYCKAITPPTIVSSFGDNIFKYNATERKIYVPKGAVEAYKAAAFWRYYADAIVGYDF